MALVKINARDILMQVSDGASSWLDIAGLHEVTVNYGENEEIADTTEYNSDGMYEHEIMQRGASMDISAHLYLDSVTGAMDPGQARLQALALLVGLSSVGSVRFRHPLETTLWTVWAATVSRGESGGGNNDKTGFEATIRRSGASTTAAVS